jgi:hypothetical protein
MPADALMVIRHTGIVYKKNELIFTLMKFGLPPTAGNQPPNAGCKSPEAGCKPLAAEMSTESKKNVEPDGESLSAQNTTVMRSVTNDIAGDLCNYLENTSNII